MFRIYHISGPARPHPALFGWMIVGLLAGIMGFLQPCLPCQLGSAAQADDWVVLFNHVHTQYSQDNRGLEPVKLTVSQAMARADGIAKAMGLTGSITITDHNNHEAARDPALHPTGVIQPIRGMEWGSSLGHAGLLGYTDGDAFQKLLPSKEIARDKQIIALVQAQGGLVIINHPRDRNCWHSQERLNADAIEIWNTLCWKPTDDSAIAWWNQFLVKGERVAVIGGSDAHFLFAPIERPVNLVFAKSNASQDVLAAIKARRLLVLAEPASPRLYLRADANGDGQYDDAMIGDVLPIRDNHVVRFEIKVEKASADSQLRLFDREGMFFSGPVGTGAGWNGNVYRFERLCVAGQRNFVRAEIRSPCQFMESLCNPIFLGE